MHDLKIDFRYLMDKSHEYFRQDGIIKPAAYAMHWSMLATNVNRIFSKNEMQEFIFRLSVVLDVDQMFDSWLGRNELYYYRFKSQSYTFTVNDLICYFGLEIIDRIDNLSDRKLFMNQLEKSVSVANFIGEKLDLIIIKQFEMNVVLGQVKDEKALKMMEERDYDNVFIDDRRLKLSEFLSKDIMKFVPETIFKKRNRAMEKKKLEIQNRKARIDKLPVFDLNKLSEEELQQCLNTMFNKEYVAEIENNEDAIEKVAKPLIYLAWLHANDFLVYDTYDFIPVEGFELNYEDYMDEDGGFLLWQTIDDYFLKDLKPVLYKLR